MSDIQREKAWTAQLLEAIAEGIMTLNHQGQITFFSAGAERITGWKKEEVLNRYSDEVFQLLEPHQLFSAFIPPLGKQQKIKLNLANGKQATLAFTGANLRPPENNDTQFGLVFQDVSESDTSHRLMGHFLANVVHEFRTPLSALAASVELLLDQAADLSVAELHELLTLLHLGILELQTLVDNLLESASIEAEHFRVHPRSSSLGKIIADTIFVMQPLLDKYNQHLVLELPAAIPMVWADARRIMQVLVNLLSNASKYGPDSAEITIGTTVNEEWVRVTVSDRGAGISPEQQLNLFDRFIHFSSDDDKTQYGVGLGLSVVKAIIEAHNGQVGVESRQDGGSVFWFTLIHDESISGR